MAKNKMVAINQPPKEQIELAVNKYGGPKKVQVIICNTVDDLRRLKKIMPVFIVGNAKRITPQQFADWVKTWRVESKKTTLGVLEIEFVVAKKSTFAAQAMELVGK